MKKHFVKTAVLTLAACALTAGPALAYTAGTGDFLIGFRQDNNVNSVVVDLGPMANFTSSQSFNLGSLASILTSNFGNGWATDGTVSMSVQATNRPSETNVSYVTSAESISGGSESQVWHDLTNTNAGTLLSKINAMGTQTNSFSATTLSTGITAVVENNTTANEYRSYMPGGNTDAGHATSANDAYGFFNPTIEGNFANGTSDLSLDLYRITNQGVSTAAADLGDFTINGNASTLTFTPDSFEAIPEPSTYAMAVFALLSALLFRFRRRSVRA